MSRPELSDEQRHELAAEWVPDSEGVLSRSAARVVIFNPAGQIYLVRGHDFGDTTHWWWFTVGGGISPSESPRQGALRELREETGLTVIPERLSGPVMKRRAEFHFALETRRQHELFFILHLTEEEAEELGRSTELTALESELLDEWKWWQLGDIREAITRGAVFYPLHLPELAAQWCDGWDGTLIETNEYEAPSDHEGH